jgi:hypothetical protein
MLMCAEGRWTAIGCGGPDGCSVSGRFVDCDDSRAADGDPCGRDGEGNAACSHDGKHVLECVDTRWRTGDACASGCKPSSDGRWVDCEAELIELRR